MASLAQLISRHHSEILEQWTQQAQRAAAARGLDRPEFQNIIPTFLRGLAEAGDDLGQFTGERREHLESHLSARLRQGFQLVDIVEEFALLGRAIAATWAPGTGREPPAHAEIARLFEELHLISVAAAEQFAQHMMQDEQIEKRYQRHLLAIAQEALQAGAPEFLARLKEVLHVAMEAMGAQSAALLLYNVTTKELELSAAVGLAEEELERTVSSLELSSFTGRVAAEDEGAVGILDAATTELTVSPALRSSGIHSLLGVRLPPRRRLLGVLYVGLTATRAFSAREKRLLENLGGQLTLHLDNAKLFADVRQQVDLLGAEREVRERFVSILAHDLRGPLGAAKVGAQILLEHPERLDVRRDLAARITRNVDRADAMIRDLLDANRVRAGERIPLRIAECDLAAVAREVYEEMVAISGDRFTLDSPDRVLGLWSAEELRRALWNLATNAVKYGAEDRPITIRVRRSPEGALAAVHNWGAPIPVDEQQHVFQAFARSHSARHGTRAGWGLGLALVDGCATAHGGHVELQSSAEAGTTFTIHLPLDSRPFQNSAAAR